MSKKQKIAIVSVINDLVTDRRVDKTCTVLCEKGYKVILIGRKLKSSLSLEQRSYDTHRMTLIFSKGVLFYLEFNLRLFFYLFFKKKDLLWANDLDTLLPNFLCSKLSGIPLIYDSHELFCEVPELKDTRIKKAIWTLLEKALIKKPIIRITVNESIATWFENKYNLKFHVVRNISSPPEKKMIKSRQELNLPVDKKIIILQGAGINIDRGAEELVEAMQYLEGILLLIIGGGDVIEKLKSISNKYRLEEKIKFIPKLKPEELFAYTSCSDLGLSLDKKTNINYELSLPNKIFDYLHAGIPVLASRMVEIEKIITTYHVGGFIENHSPEHIASQIKYCLNTSEYNSWKINTQKVVEQLNWENEKKILQEIIHSVDH